MQSLWSRAGQAHRYGCRICDTTVGRRVTTAATRQRKPTLAEVFTACYSSVFATAAVVDAIRKEDQRQELDRQLDEARRDLAAAQLLRSQETSRVTELLLPNQGALTDNQNYALWNCLRENHINRPYMKEIKQPASLRVSELLSQLQRDLHHTPDEATMQALRQTDYERLERNIISEETDPSVSERTVQNRRQLHHDGRTIVHMVRQLLKRACLAADGNSSDPSPSFYEAEKLANRYTQTFTFSYMDHKRAMETRCILNRRLREIVSSSTLGIKEMVGRVCYNLLVTPYPPDIHTYNTLIVAFDKTGRHLFAEAFVDSFLHKRRIKPTPTTLIAILHHYTDSGKSPRAIYSIARLVGLDDEASFKLGRRHVEDIEQWQMAYWLPGWNKTQRHDWVYQHTPLSVPLVEAIINTLLRFSLYDFAAKVFVTCMNVNVPLGTRTIRQLFDETILALDWRAAVRLVRGFTDRQGAQHEFPPMLFGQNDSYLISRIRVLVDICGLSPPIPSKATLDNLNISYKNFSRFKQALEALTQADDTSKLDTGRAKEASGISERSEAERAEESKHRILQIESMWREQALVHSHVTSIKSKLLYPDFSLEFRISMAVHIGEAATQLCIQINNEFLQIFSKRLEEGCVTNSSKRRRLVKTLQKCGKFHHTMVPFSEHEFDRSTQGLTTPHQSPVEEQVDEEGLPCWMTDESEIVTRSIESEAPIPMGWLDGAAGQLEATQRRSLFWGIPFARPTHPTLGWLARLW
ncbi:hypothetical protein AK830_g12457 [Neonectria ditissima]|uniref:Pentatricopeptide repeat domain-containing protein n=1 Tax=Neonectria ditissima TaxID=78410 RepID=A0A0P7B5D3_9HYPO|nr:hypothetical protein AK830_g12457 [Neonectria ditissima]